MRCTHAGIHDHSQPGGFGSIGSFFIDDTQLHPDDLCANGNGILDNGERLVYQISGGFVEMLANEVALLVSGVE